MSQAIETVVPELVDLVVKYPISEDVADRLYMDARERGDLHESAVAWVRYIALRMMDGHTLVGATRDDKWAAFQANYTNPML